VKCPGPESNKWLSPSFTFYTLGSNRISHFASQEALLAARNVHEGRVTVQVIDSFLLGGNVAKTGSDRRLETTILASPTKNFVGGGLIPF
jgi:hypothetical protein